MKENNGSFGELERELENTVLTGTPQEIAAFCKKHRSVNAGMALALACRFRGPECVKALAENGAAIGDKRYCGFYYWLALLDMDENVGEYIYSNMDENIYLFAKSRKVSKTKTLRLNSAKRRTEIVRYLMQTRPASYFDPRELFYYSLMCRDKKMTAVLKKMGMNLSEKRIAAITEGRRGIRWREFHGILRHLEDGDCFEAVQDIVAEIGEKKLHFSDSILGYEYNTKYNRSYYSDPEKFAFILEHFRHDQMNEMCIMVCAINANCAGSLEICTNYGWLKRPFDRDDLIEYAAAENKTECLAFLLDYKNRNFDLAVERERAEKKAQRKLNASPDSVTALRELFRWKKQEDGTLIIKDYIGASTVIKVPPKIGRSAVAAIGDFAFSIELYLRSLRFKGYEEPWFKARRNLSKVVLPDSIRSIGASAFAHCDKLKEINIPNGVVRIGENAFVCCEALTEIIIPDSVREIGEFAFSGCESLQTVKLSESMCEILPNMFYNCKALKRIILPGSIQSIGKMAFTECESLEEIVIPASVTEIDENAFYGSEKVTAVVEPNSRAEEYCKQNRIPFRYGTAADFNT